MSFAKRTSVPVIATLLLGLLLPAQAQARPDYRIEFILFENVDVPRDPGERWLPEVTIPTLQAARTLDGLEEVHVGSMDEAADEALLDEDDQPVDAEHMTLSDDVLRERFLQGPPDGFRRLEADELTLADQRRALDRSRRYRVLVHTGWEQPPLDHENSTDIRVHAGDRFMLERPVPEKLDFATFGIAVDFSPRATGISGEVVTDTFAPDEETIPDESASGMETLAPDADNGADALVMPSRQSQLVEAYPLDGTVRLVISRYVHVHTDLYFTRRADWADAVGGVLGEADEGVPAAILDYPGPDQMTGTASAPAIARDMEGYPLISYPVRLQRRMRSGELHHLDHPIVGMLVLVSRVERDENEGAEED